MRVPLRRGFPRSTSVVLTICSFQSTCMFFSFCIFRPVVSPTPAVSRAQKRERRRSGRFWASAPVPGSAGRAPTCCSIWVSRLLYPLEPLTKCPRQRLISLDHDTTCGERVCQAEAAIPHEYIRFGLTAEGHVRHHVAVLGEGGLLPLHDNVDRTRNRARYRKAIAHRCGQVRPWHKRPP